MSITFTKLFSSITESTIWCEPSETRIVWITMLAMADKNGRVWASVPGLANRAQVSLSDAQKALKKFLSPDEHSRTKDHEGRRIEPIDGGWRLLNHAKYRAVRDDEERKAYKRDWIKEKRKADKSVDNVDKSGPPSSKAEAYTESYTLKDKHIVISPTEKSPAVPYQKIIDVYHKVLFSLPKVAKLTSKRKSQIKQRWINDLKTLTEWENYFDYVGQSDFLMGKKPPTNGRPQFRADIEWLTNETNFAKVAEDKYHGV